MSRAQDTVYSFEFFPPKTPEGADNLHHTRETLAAFKPTFFSVTFGAGGSTRDRTFDTVLRIQNESAVDAAPHISCIGSTKDNIREMLNLYREHGIRRLVTLRGDMPSGMRDPGEIRYANELVAFIREETGDTFHIEVAAYPEYHPQAVSPQADLVNFKRKVDAGADSALTQYFYNPDAYFYFLDQCEKIGATIPIVPGIMPITNHKQLARFSDMCGAEIPRWIRKRLEAFGDDVLSLRAFGLDVTTALCDKLLTEGAPGLHIYTMNKADATVQLWQRLGLDSKH